MNSFERENGSGPKRVINMIFIVDPEQKNIAKTVFRSLLLWCSDELLKLMLTLTPNVLNSLA